MDYVIVVVLVLFSGLFSGLTLGLLSLDVSELKRKIALGNEDAKKVYPVRKKGNLLLCTLLLGNVAVNSTLAIFLGNIASGFMAGILATALIVVFGEIIPQASFSRFALQVGAKMAWLVKIFIVILFPFCFPIAWILDKALGEEMQTVYSKHELMKIVEEHEGIKESDVDADENRIIKGALTYSDKNAKSIVTPRTVMYALELHDELTPTRLKEIRESGFSRFPVYDEDIDNIVGVAFMKDFVGLAGVVKVSDVYSDTKYLEIQEGMPLDELLNQFITSRKHMAVVRGEYGGVVGIASLEDVIEEILSIEVVDEDDKIEDMQLAAKKKFETKK